MSIENKITYLLKELNIDSTSIFLNIEYLNKNLFITQCYTYHKPSSEEDCRLYELIKELILQNYVFNYEFKSALFVTIDMKQIKIEFTYPHIFYRKVDDVISLNNK
jgi:hypothetical protein